jgi:hypothetical protein
MKTYLSNLSSQTTSTSYNKNNLSLLGRMTQKTIPGYGTAFGAALTQFIDVQTIAAITPVAVDYSPGGGYAIFANAPAAGIVTLALFSLSNTTGVDSYIGKLAITLPNVPAQTHTLTSLRLNTNLSTWSILVTTTSSTNTTLGGVFQVYGITAADFTPTGYATLPMATSAGQKAVYSLQDAAAPGGLNPLQTVRGSALPMTTTSSAVLNKAYAFQSLSSFENQIFEWDTTVAPQVSGTQTGVTAAIGSSPPGGIFTTPSAHGFSSGDFVIFTSGTMPTGVSASTPYFVAPYNYTSLSITSGNPTITGFTSTAGLAVGMPVFDATTPANIPQGSYIVSIVPNTSVTMNNNAAATASGTQSIMFNVIPTMTTFPVTATLGTAGIATTTTGSGITVMRAFGQSTNTFVGKSVPLPTASGAISVTGNFGQVVPVSPAIAPALGGLDCFWFGTATNFQLGKATEIRNCYSMTGNTTNLSTTISSIPSTAGLAPGAAISGAGIPANAYIVSVTDANDIVISAAATATATGVALAFTPKTLICNFPTGSPTVNVVNGGTTTGLTVGQVVIGQGISAAATTTIASIVNSTQFTISTATTAVSLLNENGSALTFGPAASAWPSMYTVNALGTGIDIVAPTPSFWTYLPEADQVIYDYATSVFVAKPFQNNKITTWWGGTSNSYLETNNPMTVGANLAAVTYLTVVGGYVFAINGTTTGQRGCCVVDARSDASFGISALITPVQTLPAGSVLKYINTLEALFDYTDSFYFWIRSAATTSDPTFNSANIPVPGNANGWTQIATAKDLSATTFGAAYQICLTSQVLTLFANTPAQVMDIATTVILAGEMSDNWDFNYANSTNGTPSKAAFYLAKTYASAVPQLFFRWYDMSGNLLGTADTVTNASNFTYSTNAGGSWSALGTVPNTAGTLLQYAWATPPGVSVVLSIRES